MPTRARSSPRGQPVTGVEKLPDPRSPTDACLGMRRDRPLLAVQRSPRRSAPRPRPAATGRRATVLTRTHSCPSYDEGDPRYRGLGPAATSGRVLRRHSGVSFDLVHWGQTARQVHRITEQPEHLDYLTSLIVADPKHHEMTPFAAMASDMQREQSFGDVIAAFRADDRRPPVSAPNAVDSVSA